MKERIVTMGEGAGEGWDLSGEEVVEKDRKAGGARLGNGSRPRLAYLINQLSPCTPSFKWSNCGHTASDTRLGNGARPHRDSRSDTQICAWSDTQICGQQLVFHPAKPTHCPTLVKQTRKHASKRRV